MNTFNQHPKLSSQVYTELLHRMAPSAQQLKALQGKYIVDWQTFTCGKVLNIAGGSITYAAERVFNLADDDPRNRELTEPREEIIRGVTYIAPYVLYEPRNQGDKAEPHGGRWEKLIAVHTALPARIAFLSGPISAISFSPQDAVLDEVLGETLNANPQTITFKGLRRLTSWIHHRFGYEKTFDDSVKPFRESRMSLGRAIEHYGFYCRQLAGLELAALALKQTAATPVAGIIPEKREGHVWLDVQLGNHPPPELLRSETDPTWHCTGLRPYVRFQAHRSGVRDISPLPLAPVYNESI